MKEVPNTLRTWQIELVFDHFYNECPLTGKYHNVVKDHFIPISWGSIVRKYGIGGNTYANIVPLHRSINSSKHVMNPFQWFERYGKRHEISNEKWNAVVHYIAEKHKMSVFDFTNRVNACYSEVLALRWIEKINARVESHEFIHSVYFYNALKMNLNISLIVELYGTEKTKECFHQSNTIRQISECKSWFEQNLLRI